VDNGEPDISDLGDYTQLKSDFKPSSPPKFNSDEKEMVNFPKSGEHVNKSPESQVVAINTLEAEKEIGRNSISLYNLHSFRSLKILISIELRNISIVQFLIFAHYSCPFICLIELQLFEV
jgi:hypothetical protein